MRQTLIVVLLTATLLGCELPVEPLPSQESKPIADQLRTRKAPAQCSDKELDERKAENRAVIQIAGADERQRQEEQANRWMRKWERFSLVGGISGLAVGLGSFFLILYFFKQFKPAALVGGAFAGLGVLAFLLGKILAHYQLVMWLLAGLILLGAVVAWVLSRNRAQSKIAEFKDALKVLSAPLRKGASKVEDYVGELAEAEVHNVESLKELVGKL